MMPAERVQLPHLADLLTGLAETGTAGPRAVSAVELDSRRMIPGAVFVALPGERAHGRDYLEQAIARGATAVLFDADDPRWDAGAAQTCRRAGVSALGIEQLAQNLGTIAARFHGEPSSRFDTVAAITGTDGKTSVSHYLAALLDDADAPAAVLGTLGYGRPGATTDAGLTTPDAIRLQQALARLADAGWRRLALEASSHGLAQYRLDGTRIDVAVLTQLGRDHLDYHPDSDAYAAAKARLFHWPGLRAAVLNDDDAFGRALAAEVAADGVRVVTYGTGAAATLRADTIACEPGGLRCRVHHAGEEGVLQLPLLGAFNCHNVMAALATLLALDWPFVEALARTDRIRAVPGRMELFRAPGRAGVVVDYAHNAGALAAALDALRAHTAGRLWCVFGAGGDRDRGKRPLMGAAAAARADRVIVTDDNPRSEDPAAIVDEILAGMAHTRTVDIEHDRGRALALALRQAAPEDLVLLAGKGHESGQIRAGEVRPWSDRVAACEQLGLPGPGEAP